MGLGADGLGAGHAHHRARAVLGTLVAHRFDVHQEGAVLSPRHAYTQTQHTQSLRRDLVYPYKARTALLGT